MLYTTCCIQPVVYNLLYTTCCIQSVVYILLYATGCIQSVVYNLLYDLLYNLLFTTRCTNCFVLYIYNLYIVRPVLYIKNLLYIYNLFCSIYNLLNNLLCTFATCCTYDLLRTTCMLNTSDPSKCMGAVIWNA